MKIIVSHDVDHLFREDHFRDLIYPKLWIRETLSFLNRKISTKEWFLRVISPFRKKRHNIEQLIDFDSANNVPSTFFFGMSTGLGMSYRKSVALPVIKLVHEAGFDVGVHGIAYNNLDEIKKEYNCFLDLNIIGNFGIREHYVRFDNVTFEYLSKAGYLFDSSEFDKSQGYCIKNPYQVSSMWEFPLTIMDGYLPHDLKSAKEKSINILDKAVQSGLEYASILFHDYLFCDAYQNRQEWYKWIIAHCKKSGYSFISYKDAIKELERTTPNG